MEPRYLAYYKAVGSSFFFKLMKKLSDGHKNQESYKFLDSARQSPFRSSKNRRSTKSIHHDCYILEQLHLLTVHFAKHDQRLTGFWGRKLPTMREGLEFASV